MNYIAHPSFHDPGARDEILAAAPGQEPSAPENGFPCREQEAHRFRRMNYLKYIACRIRDRLDPEAPDRGELDQIDQLRAEALEAQEPDRRDPPAAGSDGRQQACPGRPRPGGTGQRR